MPLAATPLNKTNAYPKGLFNFFFVNGLFMIGLSMINALLVLYLTDRIGLSVKESYTIYAAFGAILYSSSLLGGYLGGRYDYKLAIIMGGLLVSFGSYFIAIPSKQTILFGLACFIIGGGLVVPNLYCIMGKLFSRISPLRDSGFTVVYIGMNIGGFIAAISSGFIVRYFSYSTAFIFSASMVLISLCTFLYGYKHLAFHPEEQVVPYKPCYNLRNFFPILTAIIIGVPVVMWLLNHASLSNTLLILIGVFMAVILIIIATREKGNARKRLFAFIIFTFFAIAFWALYMLAPSVLTIFVQNNVDRTIGSFIVPTSSVYSLNSFFIIILGTLTSLFFLSKSKKGKTVALAKKFATGIITMGLGYLVLTVALAFPNQAGYIAFFWIVLSYFLQTLGELFIGPIGFAMVGSLVPSRLEGLMMGVWQLSTGVAGAISGFLAAATAKVPEADVTHPLVTNPIFSQFFGVYGLVTVLIGVFILLMGSQFKKLFL